LCLLLQAETTYVTIAPDASDDWRLDEVADLIRGGAVGISPAHFKSKTLNPKLKLKTLD